MKFCVKKFYNLRLPKDRDVHVVNKPRGAPLALAASWDEAAKQCRRVVKSSRFQEFVVNRVQGERVPRVREVLIPGRNLGGWKAVVTKSRSSFPLGYHPLPPLPYF